MIDIATIEEYMRAANPIPTLDVVDADELAFAVAAVGARRAVVTYAPTQHPTRSTPAARQTELGWAGARVAEREESTMVTHQQPDIETPTPTPTPPPRPRRGPLVAAAVAVVVILAGVGIAYATGVFESESDLAAERLAVATELVDAWSAALVAADGEAVAALFTEDGVTVDPGNGTLRGRDAIMRDVESRGPGLTGALRTGDLVATDDGTFIYPSEFDYIGTGTWAGEVEVQLEGNLISRIEWLYWDLKE